MTSEAAVTLIFCFTTALQALVSFMRPTASANLALLQSHEGWRQSWDMIVPGDFGGDGNTDLLFYDRGGGVGEFYEVAGGKIALLQTESGWRSSWDVILPLRLGLDFTALVFYDRSAGTGEIYSTDGAGNTSLLKTYFDWRTTWKAIVPLRLEDRRHVPALLRSGHRLRRAVLRRC